jgi:hypothetical protein
MKYLFCLVLLSSCTAHAFDCSKGTPPPLELTLGSISFVSNPPVQPPPEMNPHFEGNADVHWNDDGRCMTLLNDVLTNGVAVGRPGRVWELTAPVFHR